MQQHPIAQQDCHLQTNRLILRPLTHADAPSIQTAASVRAIADPTISIPYPYPADEAEQYVWIVCQQLSFSITDSNQHSF